jgi:translocation and assembly module TamA
VELEYAASRLRRTGTFDAVALIEAEAAGPGDTLPNTIQVDEALPRRIGAGAEISTQDGVTVSGFWLHRNLLGGAERFRVEADVSGIGGGTGGIDYSLGAEFTRPATFRPSIDLEVAASINVFDEENYRLEVIDGSIGLNRIVNDEFSYGGGLGFVTAHEESVFGERSYTLVTLPLTAELDRRDDAFDARSGYYLSVDVDPFYGIDQAGTGVRAYADARGYLSFGAEDRVTLAARAQLGSVVGADLADVPADYLFYSGGGGTVRGFAYQSLGVERSVTIGGDTITGVTGGASFFGTQLEARVRVTDSIGVVGFADFGTVGEGTLPDSDSDWQAGVGIGARYTTPIGPLRLDIATPASGDDAFGGVLVYIGIGQSF